MSGLTWHRALTFAALLGVAAIVAAQSGVTDSVKAAEANLNLGIAYFRADNLTLAKDKLERARDQNPRNVQVHGTLALLYARLGEDARADAEFNTALRLAPSDPELLNNYAVYLCGHGKTDAGVQRFTQAAANPLYRTPWVAWTNAGVCLRSVQRDSEAAVQFDKALKAQPGFAEVVYQYADLDLARQQPALAFQRVQDWLATNPKATPDLLFTGWRAARALGDQLSALKLARRLQTDFPNSPQTLAVAGGVNSGAGNGSR
jgi:type IV pilus assembly protein PilF